MINILYILETGGPGGAETVLLNLINNLDRKRFNPSVVLLKKGWTYENLKKTTGNLYVMPSRRRYDVLLILKICRFIRANNIHIVNSHLKDMNFYSSIASRLMRIPHVAVEHGNVHLGTLSVSKRLKIKLTNLFTTKYVTISKYTSGKLSDIIGSNRKIQVIYNGSEDGFLQRPLKKTDLGFKDEDFLILNLANLYPVKNQKSLIKVAKKVVARKPQVRFLIAGRGELERELTGIIKAYGLGNNVILLGYKSDAYKYLSICDAYIQTSISEGLPVSVIEAMSYGKPVIATNVGGTEELIDKILVGPYDIDIITDKVIGLIESEKFRVELGRENYLKYKRMFTIDKMVSEYERLYKTLIK
jgi:glycosyltransferase involved in cell wall biosynthesis